MKKIIAVLLSVIMLFGTFSIAVSASTCSCPYDPIIYVYGKQELYFKDENGNYILDDDGEKINITDRELDVASMAEDMVPKFIKAFFSDDWDEFSEDFLDYVLPLYEGIGVDCDGNVIDNTTIGKESVNKLGYYEGATHGYHMGWNNQFYFDYRCSPVDIAKDFNDFVEQVKARTGHDKVVIVSRCLGCNIVITWLQMYQENADEPFNSVSKLMFMDGCFNGIDSVEALFSGNVNPSGEAVYRYLSDYDLSTMFDDNIAEFISLLLDSLAENYGMDFAIKMLLKAYDKIKDPVIAPMLRAFYATCGGNLACVNDYFEETLDYIFPTKELKTEYAKLIEKATYVHDNCTSRTVEILNNAKDSGVKIGIIAEYGFQSTPVSPEADLVGDSMLSLYNQTLGATCAEVEGTLSDEYIEERSELGYAKYISPDKQVDTSTCAFPETTWVIKNADHTFTESIHVLVVNFFRGDITVDNQTRYPQFLNFTSTANGKDGVLSDLQAVNDNDKQWNTMSGVEKGTANLTMFKTVVNLLMTYIVKIITAITNIINYAKA